MAKMLGFGDAVSTSVLVLSELYWNIAISEGVILIRILKLNSQT